MRVQYREADNNPRWDRRSRGHYEVYYIKFNHPSRPLGWWLRYTFLAPGAPGASATASLWGFCFDKENPSRNVSVREDFSIERARFDPDIFFVQIGEAAIYTMGARGRVAQGGHHIGWDLKFDTEGISSRIFPAPLYWGSWPPTKFLSPYFDTHISGTVQVDGESFTISHAKGHQGHLWGRAGAPSWAWVHCNDFSGEEGVALELLSAPVGEAEKTLFHLRLPYRDVKAHNLILPGKIVSRRETHEWVVEVPRGSEKIIVKATRDPLHCHTASYDYPDGSRRTVTNSTVASCEAVLFVRSRGVWVERSRYVSPSAAAFETACTPDTRPSTGSGRTADS